MSGGVRESWMDGGVREGLVKDGWGVREGWIDGGVKGRMDWEVREGCMGEMSGE